MQGELDCRRRLPPAWSTNSGSPYQLLPSRPAEAAYATMQLFSVQPSVPTPLPLAELPASVQLFSAQLNAWSPTVKRAWTPLNAALVLRVQLLRVQQDAP